MHLIMLFIVFLMDPYGSYAAHDSVTPYGDYSQWCSEYGICREDLGPKEAEDAIGRYFESKGLKATNMRHKGRFVEADIFKDKRLVDKVLFDRKTGRIRSTY